MADNLTLSSSTPEQPESILLVDDNPTNLQVLFQTLNGHGYKLLIAKSGEQALQIVVRYGGNSACLTSLEPATGYVFLLPMEQRKILLAQPESPSRFMPFWGRKP